MTLTPTRQTLITLLSDGQFHSGEQLGEQLGISRAAVSKHMAALKELGLDLFSLTGKGYRLAVPMALYDQVQLQALAPMAPVHCFPVIDSTNQYLLERVNQLQSGESCLAECQTAGRGRLGAPGGERAHDGNARTIGECFVFARKFRASVHTLGIGRIGFNVRTKFCSVKDIIGTDVHKVCANCIARFGHPTHRCSVDQHRGIGVVFTSINSCECGTVNDCIWINRRQRFVNSLATSDVDRVNINPDGFVTSGGNHSHQVLTELTIGSSNEDAHYFLPLSGSHHQRLSRYHCTVSASASSRVRSFFQPNFVILSMLTE